MAPRIISETLLTAADDAAIRAALCRCFPADHEIFSRTRAWHGTYPTWTVLVEQKGLVIAHVGIVEREILVDAQRLGVAGVQNVFVVPEHRKSGLFQRIMSVAMEESARRNLDLGLLFCTPEIAQFYVPLGWRIVEGRGVIRIDSNGLSQPLPTKNVVMFYPLRRLELPTGDLHLRGNDW
jgi:predicted N-acetyltransferase YhbS